jgi:hypothetical protein
MDATSLALLRVIEAEGAVMEASNPRRAWERV